MVKCSGSSHGDIWGGNRRGIFAPLQLEALSGVYKEPLTSSSSGSVNLHGSVAISTLKSGRAQKNIIFSCVAHKNKAKVKISTWFKVERPWAFYWQLLSQTFSLVSSPNPRGLAARSTSSQGQQSDLILTNTPPTLSSEFWHQLKWQQFLSAVLETVENMRLKRESEVFNDAWHKSKKSLLMEVRL